MNKNVASQKVTLLAIDTSTNTPKTGDAANLTAYVAKDDGAVTQLGDTTATEVDATNAKGLYVWDLTQAETNANKLVFSGKSSTANIALVPMTVYTRPANASTLAIDGSGNVTAGALSATAIQSIWDAATTGLVTVGSIGKALLDNWSTILGRVTALRAGYLDNLSGGAVSLNTDMSALLLRLTPARAGYLDNLNVGGSVASQADINALNQSAARRVILTTVPSYERPESGTVSYTIEARTFDGDGALVAADTTPTLAPIGIITGSLAANLGAASIVSTGVYRWTYTVAPAATREQIRFDLTATIAGSPQTLSVFTQVVDLVATTWTSTDAANLTAIFNKLPANAIADQTLLAALLGTPAGASLADDVAAVKVDTTSLVGRVTNTLFAGMTSLGRWLGQLAGKSSDATTLAEIQATAGGATFTPATDSLEAIRDRGDAAWLTGDAGGGTGPYAVRLTFTADGSPLQGVTVRIREGVTALTRTTDAAGLVEYSVAAATWSVEAAKDGYDFTATTLAVSGDVDHGYVLTRVVPAAPAAVGRSTGVGTAIGTDGLPAAGLVATFRLVSGPGDAGSVFDGADFTVTSGGDGRLEYSGFVRGATYRGRLGASGTLVSFVVPDANSFELPELVSKD